MHCLILLSLFLQVFLFFTADLRRRRASLVVRTVLWLAYLSADSVAIFTLGHLAVHAQGPSHELMLFWAPFVLVHLGGQDNITAFSKQDNELWRRQLLNVVTQAAVAGYVVSKSSWPDARLRAAMVLMFLSGFLKYAGRTYCLYLASPGMLRTSSLNSLSDTVRDLREQRQEREMHEKREKSRRKMIMSIGNRIKEERFERMFIADDSTWKFIRNYDFAQGADDIMSVDAPVNDVEIIGVADYLPDVLGEFECRQDRCMAYHYVAACLVQSYKYLYTKEPLLQIFICGLVRYTEIYTSRPRLPWHGAINKTISILMITILILTPLFQPISTLTALALFTAAEKEGHYSKVDVIVSYILLVGAIALDILPALPSIVSYARKPFCLERGDECAQLCVHRCNQPPGWLTRKQWSEEVAQYSMIKRHTSSVPSLVKWIGTHLGASWCIEFFELTRTHVTDDLKLAVLDKLFLEARRQEWDLASFRGERALGKWMDTRNHWQVFPASERSAACRALHESTSSRVDFPISVLIWHIATDICYFTTDDRGPGTEPDEIIKKKKKISRELSHYIMYLLFKCDVMVTSSSRLAHQKAHEKLAYTLSASQQSPHIKIDEKGAVIQVFKHLKEQEKGSMPPGEAQGSKNQEPDTSTSSRIQELLRSTEEALYSPVLPHVHAVAKELIGIDDQAERWHLILEVWLEMLFYTAPRCGAASHYEHLSTGGEFITHVLLLMRLLGPFLPKPGA